MATSPNYAWAEPDNSSLVKNGASDIRTLGDAIDTSVWNVGFGQAGKNKIINGDMAIAQRATSAAGITADNTYNTVDRFLTRLVNMGTFTQSQESDGPAGFAKSLKMLCTTADASPAASDRVAIVQKIEGNNVQNFAYGTASAKTMTVSFYVKSNVTGTFVMELFNSFSTTPKSLSRAYTVSAVNTWERKSFVIAGDTSTVFTADNAERLSIIFWLGAGSNFTSGTLQSTWTATVDANRAAGQTNLAAAINNYWQVTGVQIEMGDYATPFNTASGQSVQAELAMCQRYYVPAQFGIGQAAGSTTVITMNYSLPVEMRAAPSATLLSGTSAVTLLGTGNQNVSSISINASATRSMVLLLTGSGYTSNGIYTASQPSKIEFSAEL